MSKKGRTTVYNEITSKEKLKQVNEDNLQLEEDFLEYLASIDRSKGTIKQYKANLHIFWCWNLESNKNKFFVDLTKREIAKFQSHALNIWKWSPKRIRTVKATISSLSNYVENILDDEYEGYKPIVRKIESPADEAVRVKTVFQIEDLQPLLDTLVERKYYMKACILALAMYSGKRKAELTRFKVSYFNKENLICDGALYKTPEKMQTKGRGQRGKLLDVYTLAKPFQPYLDLWMRERERRGVTTDWLFPKYKDGQYIDEHIDIPFLDSLARTFTKMLGKCFYWHSIRHYFTTQLSESGLPDGIIQDIQGWASSDMVRIYVDTDSEKQFEKYFGSEGIKQVEQKGLADL
ncbi:MAG: site-specific integrase [Bacteroidales bacterium]|nr:site-specific integrase [Bacteroidales bacterium]